MTASPLQIAIIAAVYLGFIVAIIVSIVSKRHTPKICRMKVWKPSICFGWFNGNPISGFEIHIMSPMADYPSGYSCIEIIGIRFLLFEFGIWFNKPGA